MENVKALGSLEKWASVRNKYLAQAEALGYSVKYSVFALPIMVFLKNVIVSFS